MSASECLAPNRSPGSCPRRDRSARGVAGAMTHANTPMPIVLSLRRLGNLQEGQSLCADTSCGREPDTNARRKRRAREDIMAICPGAIAPQSNLSLRCGGPVRYPGALLGGPRCGEDVPEALGLSHAGRDPPWRSAPAHSRTSPPTARHRRTMAASATRSRRARGRYRRWSRATRHWGRCDRRAKRACARWPSRADRG